MRRINNIITKQIENVGMDKIAKYKAFLAERNALKAQVDADCKEAGIR